MRVTGRLAPTPSGHLHLGNALAFAAAWLSARAQGGRLLLRIEDLDRARARDDIANAQRDDLRWLGITWDDESPPQSTRAYSVGDLPVFRCVCTRATRLAGGCRCRDAHHTEGPWRFRAPREALRFTDRVWGEQRFAPDEDPVLMRADGEAAYPLAVVVDDLRDGVTEVVRGADLLSATATQLLLYRCLGARPPSWTHVPVIYGPDGKKLSKSHGSTELRALRAGGWSAERVWSALLPLLGMPGDAPDPMRFDPARVPRRHYVAHPDGSLTPRAG
ncbi:MAG: glutamate--tRNA ligase family protein [Polyangiales bacterium]